MQSPFLNFVTTKLADALSVPTVIGAAGLVVAALCGIWAVRQSLGLVEPKDKHGYTKRQWERNFREMQRERRKEQYLRWKSKQR